MCSKIIWTDFPFAVFLLLNIYTLCNVQISGSQRLLTKDDEFKLLNNVGIKWRFYARALGFSDGQIDIISHDYDREGLQEKVRFLSHTWPSVFYSLAPPWSRWSRFWARNLSINWDQVHFHCLIKLSSEGLGWSLR